MAVENRILQGIGVSPGSAYAPAVLVAPPVQAPADEPAPSDANSALLEVKAAFESVATELDARAAAAPKTAAQILSATALIARDKGLHKAAGKHLAGGNGPANAVHLAVEEYVIQFEALGDYFAERVTDLRDVGARAISVLLGLPAPGVPRLAQRSIVVALDLAPADTAVLDKALVAGIVTQAGGRNSHTAILAAQMGIPAVVHCAGALDIEIGTALSIDGDTGKVLIDPEPEIVAALADRDAKRADVLSSSTGTGRTSDGHAVALLANIGGVDDAVAAAATDVEGVGLFRTEFVFLSAKKAPTLQEQTDIYTKVFEPFGHDRRIVVRTLDAGADKPLAFADLGEEENPALGRRGLRLSQARPQLLQTQLEALGAAASATGADVRVMAPMVATLDEASWFAEQVAAAGLPTSGVMIEVPAAALSARHVLGPVDFGSLGTNDLAQYTMAADRMEGALSDLLDPWQPAVLSVIKAACDAAAELAKPIGVCGESGGDPLMALVLTGMGVGSLSMAPSKVAIVRFALSRHSLQECRRLAALALSAPTAADALDAVRTAADAELVAIL